jgi:hypothetical protein
VAVLSWCDVQLVVALIPIGYFAEMKGTTLVIPSAARH